MENPTKIFIGGAICAALVFGALHANTYRLKSKLHQLESDCVEEGKRDREKAEQKQPAEKLNFSSQGEPIKDPYDDSVDSPHALAKAWEEATLLCKADELVRMESTPSAGIQTQLVEAQQDVWKSKHYDYIAKYILLISAIPWLWYFLLGRIRELRDAITGN